MIIPIYCSNGNVYGKLFIDDSIINCQRVIENNIDTLLFDNIFNKDNKDFSKVINNAKEVIKEHPNFDSYVKENKNTSLSYIFKNTEDQTKKVRLELILFNCI